MSNYLETSKELSQKARSFARNVNSLKEEIGANDKYNQRDEPDQNEELKKNLHHNMIEEE